jgi:hypothetical protein
MIEILDKNGNRRAYVKSEEGAELEIARLTKERPNMAPFTSSGEPESAPKKKRASKKTSASQ